VTPPALVLWGEVRVRVGVGDRVSSNLNPNPSPNPNPNPNPDQEDDVLPVEDAFKYEKDLPNCVGVTLIPDAQHAPALENPSVVADTIIKFTKEKAWQKKAVAA